MNVLRKEPALAAGVVAAVLGLLVIYRVLDRPQAEAWQALAVVLIPLVQALVTRARVMPVATVKQAGYDPACVRERADDPRVPPFVSPK